MKVGDKHLRLVFTSYSIIPISVAVCRLPCVAVDNRKLIALSLA